MESTSTKFHQITDEFSHYLKLNVHGNLILGTRQKEIREAWAGFDEETRVVVQGKALVRELAALQELGRAVNRQYRDAARKNARLKKAPAPAKYKDKETGKTWTGHGKRPGWFGKAIEAGMKAEEMAIEQLCI